MAGDDSIATMEPGEGRSLVWTTGIWLDRGAHALSQPGMGFAPVVGAMLRWLGKEA